MDKDLSSEILPVNTIKKALMKCTHPRMNLRHTNIFMVFVRFIIFPNVKKLNIQEAYV